MALPEKHVLSKSTYIRSLQCEKSLYLYKHQFKLRDEISPQMQAVFRRGTNVGELARDLFPGGIDVSPPNPFTYAQSVADTASAIAASREVIYEAAFQFEKVLVAIDILVLREGKWHAYEVKSSTSISETYYRDAALQHYVITRAGLPLESINIVNINNQYVRQGVLDLHELFNSHNVTALCLKRAKATAKAIARAFEVIAFSAVPEVKIGLHCSDPYTCDFRGTCWKHIPPDSLFEFAGMQMQKRFKLIDQGLMLMKDIPVNLLNKTQLLQQQTMENNEPIIDTAHLQTFLHTLAYPLHYLDFETIAPAVPLFNNSRPYQQIPFQWSMHTVDAPQATLRHQAFLAEAGTDPREKFVTSLLEYCGTEGSVVVYNEVFERERLRELALLFPKFEQRIQNVISRMVDLMVPFRQHWYYHGNMNGSYSIKAVLPALVPGPWYEALAIGDGALATTAFESLQTETDLVTIAEVRDQLLAYCHLDTYAMVKIMEVLRAATADTVHNHDGN